MNSHHVPSSLILAELLRLERWEGGDSIEATRIFGLLHGFESIVNAEIDSYGISEETQAKVEAFLQEIENEEATSDTNNVMRRLRSDNVDQSDAGKIIELCRMQGRFPAAIEKLIEEPDSLFHHLKRSSPPERNWHGATHFMELVDCTAGARNRLHGVFAPAVPRVGEIVVPEGGSKMIVIGVEHHMTPQGIEAGITTHRLIPHVLLKAEDEVETAAEAEAEVPFEKEFTSPTTTSLITDLDEESLN
ncbi:hypothetical protein [Schlesneria sp. T3-172]|uniref:hypothetical protein n=1 Tax=Schlesneria sphaerica TaxID=3373610 RepID=UPI0037C64982